MSTTRDKFWDDARIPAFVLIVHVLVKEQRQEISVLAFRDPEIAADSLDETDEIPVFRQQMIDLPANAISDPKLILLGGLDIVTGIEAAIE